MTTRANGANETFWMWDGEAEYQGEIVTVDGHRLTARMRQIRRWTMAGGSPGRPVPGDLLERQLTFTRRLCFGQSPAVQMGALLEFRIGAVQRSRNPQFDYLLTGTFAAIHDEHLEALSGLNSDQAHHYLQSRRNGGTSTGT